MKILVFLVLGISEGMFDKYAFNRYEYDKQEWFIPAVCFCWNPHLSLFLKGCSAGTWNFWVLLKPSCAWQDCVIWISRHYIYWNGRMDDIFSWIMIATCPQTRSCRFQRSERNTLFCSRLSLFLRIMMKIYCQHFFCFFFLLFPICHLLPIA